jgi:hypothetical protein
MLSPPRDIDQANHHGDFDERTDHRGERCPLSIPNAATATAIARSKLFEAVIALFLDLRAPKKLRFARQQRIFARFSPPSIEPVPLRMEAQQ